MSGPLRVALLIAALASSAWSQPGSDQATGVLRKGDSICLIGNALAERMQHHGWLETLLHTQVPELNLSLRNLGFSADTLTIHQRTAGFDSRDEYLTRCQASLILAFYGFVESFDGVDGLAKFRQDLDEFLAHSAQQDYSGSGAPRVVLFSSVPFENTGDTNLPDGAQRNQWIQRYNAVIAEAAQAAGVLFVDLFTPMQRAYQDASEPLTINGIHLTRTGNRVLGAVIVEALLGRLLTVPADGAGVQRLRSAVVQKNLLWFNRYRATDGYNVYGGRSSLKYTDDLSNYTVLQREMEILDAMCRNEDRRLWSMAQGRDSGVPDVAVPPALPVKTNKPGQPPEGLHHYLGGKEAIAKMTPAPGMKINLFASEERFPELVNPVQMAFDTAGRLWVATWPTYPHWTPGLPMNDALMVLTDTDGDGEADQMHPFADDLHNPTGFEFWNGGVLVACCPDLLFLKDTDGDGRADHREHILHGLSSADTHHAANSFVLGPGGAVYFQEGTFHQSQVESIFGPVRNHNGTSWRFEPRTYRVERYTPYNFANPHGHVFDRWGQDFLTDGTGNVNYYVLPFSGHVDHPTKHRGYFPFFQQRSRPCAGTEILSSRHFPEENQGNYLVANVIGFQGIFQYRIEDDASGFSATEVDPIVHSSDKNFRPSDLEMGPDGALYFLDWHNTIIGHMQHHLRDPSRDVVHGRVYRVTAEGRELSPRPKVAGQPIDALLELLKSPVDRERYWARIELSGHDSDEVVTKAAAWANSLDPNDPDLEHHLLEALWLHQQHNRIDVDLLERMLRSSDHRARTAATRVVRGSRHLVGDTHALLARQIRDEHPRVRLEALVALSFLGSAEAAETALLVLQQPMDRFLDYALTETMTALESHWRAALVAGQPFAESSPESLAYCLQQLSTTELRSVRPSAALHQELVSRYGLAAEEYHQSLEALARARGTSVESELLRAIETADGKTHGHVDHHLMGLFATLQQLAPDARANIAEPLGRLSTEGQRASTRKMATVARVVAEGSLDAAWKEATRSTGNLGDFLDAVPLLDDDRLCSELYDKLLPLLDGPPANLTVGTSRDATRGRYVRIELPGEKRMLTLAEVEVFHDGENIALQGKAKQSSTQWGGKAKRGIDGNTSGTYSDNGQTHTRENGTNPWWEVDLGGEEDIDGITIWNRTEDNGKFLSRLDGYVLRVLDRDRRTVFRVEGEKAPEKDTVDLSDPTLRIRRAAARALPTLGVRQAEVVDALVSRFGDARMRAAVVESLRSVPLDRWTPASTKALAGSLQQVLQDSPDAEFESRRGKELLVLADELAMALPADVADSLRRTRRQKGPQVIVIRPVPDTLTYDRKSFKVVAGRPVELVFVNVDIMPHNLLLAAPGSLAKVGLAAEEMAAEPNAWAKNYVPDLEEVLHTSKLLLPGESETLRFDAPDATGDYPYVCTFPGHWIRMNGVMQVVADYDSLVETEDVVAQTEQSAREFVKNWTFQDLEPHLDEVADHSPARGREIFEAASCLRCHSVKGEGSTTGPDLLEVVGKYERPDLLRQILEPSTTIAEDYVTEIFFTHDGDVFAGQVQFEDATHVKVQTDPYQALDPVVIQLADVEVRKVSKISAMPTELLSTFQRKEILHLMAYLESLKQDSKAE